MHVMRASLGVRCDYCHDVEHYEADTKETKIVARRMIRMVLDLNANAFGGRPAVTCNTCHRGAVRPVVAPPIGQGQFADTTRTPRDAAAVHPTAADVLRRYVEAAGGPSHLRAVVRRDAEGTLSRAAVVPGDGGRPAVVNRGRNDPVVLRAVADGEVTLTAGVGADAVTQHVTGGAGVVGSQSLERPMTPTEVERLLTRVDVRRELSLLERAVTLTVLDKADIDGRAMNVLERRLSGGRWEHLYFGVEDGLLRRWIVFSPTPIGADPEQVDFEDYRTVDEITVPFVIRTSYLDDNHYGTTLRFVTIRHAR
jgi:hypothetical protein